MLTIGEFAGLGQVSPRMLRHYDERGLLVPELVGPSTGYRLYGVHQLGPLHKIVALRDLGLSLEQVRQAVVSEGDLHSPSASGSISPGPAPRPRG
jgi:DNA-binding transcriptional MerR regulator